MPAFFVFFDPVEYTELARVVENELRGFKAHAMFRVVADILSLVPFKAHVVCTGLYIS